MLFVLVIVLAIVEYVGDDSLFSVVEATAEPAKIALVRRRFGISTNTKEEGIERRQQQK